VTLVVGDWLVTSGVAHADWGVKVADGAIAEVGPARRLRDRYPDSEVISGGIVAPGFVDSHTHLYGVLAHGIPVDAPNGFWSFLNEFWWPRVEDALTTEMVVAATRLMCAEMLLSGITSFYDIVEAPNTLPGVLLEQRQAVAAAGIRGVLSFEATERVSTRNGLVGLDENTELIETCRREGGLVTGLMSFHTVFTCSEGLIREAFERAESLDVLVHAHVNEGTHEPEWCMANLGMRTFEYYESLGLAGPRFLASQCVQLSESERRIISETEIRCSHMPLSNCEVGGGIAPVPEQLQAGVTMGLGSDSYISDFFEVMRGAFLIHKARLMDPTVMPAATVFRMATEGSAAALGLEVGRLEAGWPADLQVIDMDMATPVTEHNVFDQLVLWRNRSHVTDVMVDGVWRVRNREVIGTDVPMLRAKTAEYAEAMWA